MTSTGKATSNPVNKLVHFVCVPLIFFSIIGLLSSIPHGFTSGLTGRKIYFFINFALLVIVPGLFFYARLSGAIFTGMLIISAAALIGNYYLKESGIAPLWLSSLIIFTAAWIGQFIGHKIEKKRPSFFNDLFFLLIGPAWILGFVYRKLGIKY